MLALATALLIASCSPSSRIVKGNVMMRTTSEAHVDHGIHVGDTLAVYREEPLSSHETRTRRVGLVRVIKLIDKDYSAVEVLEGSLKEGDTIEKQIH
jgi:hypothetical protein